MRSKEKAEVIQNSANNTTHTHTHTVLPSVFQKLCGTCCPHWGKQCTIIITYEL